MQLELNLLLQEETKPEAEPRVKGCFQRGSWLCSSGTCGVGAQK